MTETGSGAPATAQRVFAVPEDLATFVGQELGVSNWHTVTQESVNGFADCTDDHQWIHVDVERAASGPFGGPIAHGFLTLSLMPSLLRGLYRVERASMGVNYGLDKVRFVNPVPIGSRIRARARVASVSPEEGRVKVTLGVTVELEGQERPACVADFVVLWLK